MAVWRYPCILATDIERWTAVPFPEGAMVVPDNTVVVSTRGRALTRLQGGDFDGDVVSFSFNGDLVRFLDATSSVDELNIEEFEQDWQLQTYTESDHRNSANTNLFEQSLGVFIHFICKACK